jgi:hypothetical protein
MGTFNRAMQAGNSNIESMDAAIDDTLGKVRINFNRNGTHYDYWSFDTNTL